MKKLLLILTKNTTMKRLFILFFLPLLFTTCKKEHANEVTEIGANYQGGIVFYIDETGEHGLLLAPYDDDFDEGGANHSVLNHTGHKWGCYGTDVTGGYNGADETALGTGHKNTIDIENQDCTTDDGSKTAVNAVVEYESGGYADWFLPSKDELVELQKVFSNNNLGGFGSIYYWSSSEYDSTSAWCVNFHNGEINTKDKDDVWKVRAIRSF